MTLADKMHAAHSADGSIVITFENSEAPQAALIIPRRHVEALRDFVAAVAERNKTLPALATSSPAGRC